MVECSYIVKYNNEREKHGQPPGGKACRQQCQDYASKSQNESGNGWSGPSTARFRHAFFNVWRNESRRNLSKPGTHSRNFQYRNNGIFADRECSYLTINNPSKNVKHPP